MARVVCVHGVGWAAGGTHAAAGLVANVAGRPGQGGWRRGGRRRRRHGVLRRPVRPPGESLGVGDPLLGPQDVEPGWEQEQLLAWWRAAAEADPAVAPPGADTLARVPGSVQAALRQLSRSRFFAGIATRALVFDLKQVHRYLADPELRAAARSGWRR